MSFILLGILNAQAAGAGEFYYLASYKNASTSLQLKGNHVSGSSFYFTGSDDSNIYTLKSDSSGEITWQRNIGGVSFDEGNNISEDASGNVYIASRTDSGKTFGSRAAGLVKYNSSGVIQWQRVFEAATDNNNQGRGIAVDSADNIYMSGTVNDGDFGNSDIFLTKYNSSGTLQFQRYLGATAESSIAFDCATDSNDDIAVIGYSRGDGPGDFSGHISKYNSSGVIQWQRSLGDANRQDGIAITVDNSNNIYISLINNGQPFIAKYNSSGVIQWQRSFSTSGKFESLATDSSGNIYAVGNEETTTTKIFLVKYNSAGVLQWQRTIDATDTQTSQGISIDSQGNIIISGTNFEAVDRAIIAKLPNDGSLTGTYVVDGTTYTYATSSFSESAGSLTDAAGTLSEGAGTGSSNTSTMTDGASSATATIVEMTE